MAALILFPTVRLPFSVRSLSPFARTATDDMKRTRNVNKLRREQLLPLPVDIKLSSGLTFYPNRNPLKTIRIRITIKIRI